MNKLKPFQKRPFLKQIVNRRVKIEIKTRFVDLIAGIITALTLWCLSFLLTPPELIWRLLPYHIKFAFAGVVCFVIVTLLSYLIPEKLRTHIGWFIIAILGIMLSSYVKEEIQRVTLEEPDFFDAFSPFPFEIFLFLLPSIAFMGITHFLGQAVITRKYKNA